MNGVKKITKCNFVEIVLMESHISIVLFFFTPLINNANAIFVELFQKNYIFVVLFFNTPIVNNINTILLSNYITELYFHCFSYSLLHNENTILLYIL